MNKIDREIAELLNGAPLIRQSNHFVYRLQNGHNYVRPKTPGDWRSSRNSKTQLRKLLAKTPRADAVETLNENSVKEALVKGKKRFVSGQRDAGLRTDTDFRMVIGTAQEADDVHSVRACRPLTSLMDLAGELESLGEFWTMKSSGRTALLKSFISEFARVQSILVRFCPVEVRVGQTNTVKSPSRLDRGNILSALKKQTWQQTWLRHLEIWKLGGVESLLVNDPDLGDVVVDVCGSRNAGGRDDIVIIPAEFDAEGTQITYWPIWLSDAPSEEDWDQHFPDRFISYAFFNSVGIKKWGIENFSTFSTKAQTRSAAQALRRRLAESGATEA